MSFRNEPQNADGWMAKVNSDIRKLYKCCGKRVKFAVTGTGVPTAVAGQRTARWIPNLGSAILRSLQLSASPAPAAVPLVVDVLKNGVMVAQIVLAVGDELQTVNVSPSVSYASTDALEFVISSGSAGYVAVTAIMEAGFISSGGLVFG